MLLWIALILLPALPASLQDEPAMEVINGSNLEEQLDFVTVMPIDADVSLFGGQGCLIENGGPDSCSNGSEVTTVTYQTSVNPVVPDICKLDESPDCSNLPAGCLNCTHSYQCIYGQATNATCRVLEGVDCKGDRVFNHTFVCQYCYQTGPSEHVCSGSSSCKSASAPRQSYLSNCVTLSNVTCLGSRKFLKKLPCNWTSGYRWSTAFLLSIFGGGFGADRFYLGYWQEGIGKLFSFGGLGVWTLVDVVLIGVRFLGPADGSLYVD